MATDFIGKLKGVQRELYYAECTYKKGEIYKKLFNLRAERVIKDIRENTKREIRKQFRRKERKTV